jgi:hypothetical protein
MKMRVPVMMLLGAALMLGPALQSGEAGSLRLAPRDVVLYELNEQARIIDRGPSMPPLREAMSGLQGKAKRGTPLCPEGLMAYAEAVLAELDPPIIVKDANRCTVVAFATSVLTLGSMQGTIDGTFSVVVNTDKTNFFDSAEFVVMAGAFSGTIQVFDSDLVTIDILTGSFTPEQIIDGFPLPAAATFTGKFRLPFKVHHGAVYKTDNGGLVPVRLDERALGDPTVRVEIRFDRNE